VPRARAGENHVRVADLACDGQTKHPIDMFPPGALQADLMKSMDRAVPPSRFHLPTGGVRHAATSDGERWNAALWRGQRGGGGR
jgi:hypothetical protein